MAIGWLGPSCDAVRLISAQSNRTVSVARSQCAAGFAGAAASRPGAGGTASLPGLAALDGASLCSLALTGSAIAAIKALSPAGVGPAAASMLSPEVFPRADGTTYVCGISSESPLPIDPGLVAPDDGAIDRLKALCDRMSPVLARAPVLASQACYRPVSADGMPLIGAVPGARGAYVATGHGV